MKVHPIPHASFETTASRFIQVLQDCSVSCLLYICYLKPLYFGQKEQSEISRLLSGWVKIHQIPYVMFETTSQFFFKLFVTLQCHEKLFCTFLAGTVHDLDKRSPSKCKVQTFHGSCKISLNLYFHKLFLFKVYKTLAKKVQRSYVS